MRVYRSVDRWRFKGSGSYWENRYSRGGKSGPGSYGRLARMKAEYLNSFVADHHIRSVIEFGCGDGNQVRLSQYPKYTGVDVSDAAIRRCQELFRGDASKQFLLSGSLDIPTAELGLSTDVIYHLVEDDVFENYMSDLLNASERYAILYTSDAGGFVPPEKPRAPLRHRHVQRYIAERFPEWKFIERVANSYPYVPGDETTSFADFYVYERSSD